MPKPISKQARPVDQESQIQTLNAADFLQIKQERFDDDSYTAAQRLSERPPKSRQDFDRASKKRSAPPAGHSYEDESDSIITDERRISITTDTRQSATPVDLGIPPDQIDALVGGFEPKRPNKLQRVKGSARSNQKKRTDNVNNQNEPRRSRHSQNEDINVPAQVQAYTDTATDYNQQPQEQTNVRYKVTQIMEPAPKPATYQAQQPTERGHPRQTRSSNSKSSNRRRESLQLDDESQEAKVVRGGPHPFPQDRNDSSKTQRRSHVGRNIHPQDYRAPVETQEWYQNPNGEWNEGQPMDDGAYHIEQYQEADETPAFQPNVPTEQFTLPHSISSTIGMANACDAYAIKERVISKFQATCGETDRETAWGAIEDLQVKVAECQHLRYTKYSEVFDGLGALEKYMKEILREKSDKTALFQSAGQCLSQGCEQLSNAAHKVTMKHSRRMIGYQ